MTIRRPLVNIGGVLQELPVSDIVASAEKLSIIDISASDYGESLVLPDATSLVVGKGYLYVNNSAYDKRVLDFSGTLLGFISSDSSVKLYLSDNSTQAGIWVTQDLSKIGLTLEKSIPVASNNGTNTYARTVLLDSNRILFITITGLTGIGGSPAYGIIYDKSTDTWGNSVLLRSAVWNLLAIKIDTDKVLIVDFLDTSTTMTATVLSTSGTAITVNTPVTATLAGAIGTTPTAITLVGTAVIVPYTRATTVSGMRAITVSGTVPTIGTEVTITGTTIPAHIYANTSSTFTCIGLTSGANVYIKTNSISGSTITAGTEISTATDSNTIRTAYMSSGRIAIFYSAAGVVRGGFCSISGTVPSLSTVVLGSTTSVAEDMIVVNSSKLLCVSRTSTARVGINHLIDTAGTASAGTPYTLDAYISTVGSSILGILSGIAKVFVNLVSASYSNATYILFTVDTSSTSPSVTYSSTIGESGATGINLPPLVPISSDVFNCVISPTIHPTGTGYIIPAGIGKTGSMYIRDTITNIKNTVAIGQNTSTSNPLIQGFSRNEMWRVWGIGSRLKTFTRIETVP